MSRLSVIFLLACATASLSGCLSTEVTESETCGTRHIVVSDYGWKLFNWIPIFRSDITMKRVQEELAAEAAKRGAVATDLVYHNSDTVMFDVPLIGFSIPIPYIVCYKEIQLSGVLK